ncbi:MAG: J domain-containing protein [Actinobacteria bacterium]|nr:J domain-containing protein [Actinomycetota bacterium]
MDELHEARRLLDVDVNATRIELRRAFRQAAKKTHPDAGGAATEFDSVERAFRLVEAGPGGAESQSLGVLYDTGPAAVAASRRPGRNLGSSFATVLARHLRDQPADIVR